MDADSTRIAGIVGGDGNYSADFALAVLIPGSSFSKCAWKRFLESSVRPVNSIPMPTPGSRVRTTAEAETCSWSSQNSTRSDVAMASGMTVST